MLLFIIFRVRSSKLTWNIVGKFGIQMYFLSMLKSETYRLYVRRLGSFFESAVEGLKLKKDSVHEESGRWYERSLVKFRQV